MKKFLALFILIYITAALSSCVISDEYYYPEKQEEPNKPVTNQTVTKGTFNETFDTIKDRCNGFNIVNGLLYIDMSKRLYMYDPDNGDRVILCSDPSCDHRGCLWGSADSDAFMLSPHQEIVKYENKVFFSRQLIRNTAVKLENGEYTPFCYQLISADFDGKNIVKHHENFDYIANILPVTEEYLYFVQRDIYNGTYGLYKLNYRNNDIELLKDYAVSIDLIFEKDGYLYYTKSIEGSLAKLNLETLEEKTLLDDFGGHTHYDDTYIYYMYGKISESQNSSVYRYNHETEEEEKLPIEASRIRVSDEHIFFTKDEGLIIEGPERSYKDGLSGRIYMCDKDGSNVVLLRDDYEKIYYRSFYMYKDKLYADFYYYDENLVDNLVNHSKHLYGYVTIGDMASDYTLFDVAWIND